jgi:hypothetical protein
MTLGGGDHQGETPQMDRCGLEPPTMGQRLAVSQGQVPPVLVPLAKRVDASGRLATLRRPLGCPFDERENDESEDAERYEHRGHGCSVTARRERDAALT